MREVYHVASIGTLFSRTYTGSSAFSYALAPTEPLIIT